MSLLAALNRAQSSAPFDGFVLCDLVEVVGGTSYYGYQTLNGAWMVKSYDDITGALRYCAGVDNYAATWTARASLTYTLPFEA